MENEDKYNSVAYGLLQEQYFKDMSNKHKYIEMLEKKASRRIK